MNLVEQVTQLERELASAWYHAKVTASEIEQLRAENKHLRQEVNGRPSSALHDAALAEKDAEIERLRASERSAWNAAVVRDEEVERLRAERDDFHMQYRMKCDEETKALRAANTKLVGAIDLIRETLNGGEVQDLHQIINAALAEYRAAQKPSKAQELGTDIWAGLV